MSRKPCTRNCEALGGVKSLHSREGGLYEASDFLLGDHLCQKSDTVQWIAVEKPEKEKSG